MRINWKIGIPFVFAAVLLAACLGVYIWKQENRPSLLEIYVFNLKNGRSMLIRTFDDKRILVDGGSNSSIINEITEIMPFYSRRIDIIISTTDQGKNVSGLIDVLNRYDVGKVYVPAVRSSEIEVSSSTDSVFDIFIDSAVSNQIELNKIGAGQAINLGSGTRLEILFPVPSDNFSYSRTSAPEILFKITYGSFSMVFMGNATPKIQKSVAADYKSSRGAEILMYSHNAAPSKIATQLIENLKPARLVYSKTISNTDSSESSTSKAGDDKSNKKQAVDPLAYMNKRRKFNLKETGTIKITATGAADGIQITTEKSGLYKAGPF